MNNKEWYETLPLRQRKFAQTKLGLLHAATAEMSRTPFELIRLKDLCRKMGISDGSFFNYFGKKSDLIAYFIHLWALEMGWHAERLAARQGGLAAIEKIFGLTARQAREQPGLLPEIIAQQARMHRSSTLTEITLAERLLAFPDLDGIDGVHAAGLRELLSPLIKRAVAEGELPRAINRETVMIAIATVFFGTPVTVRSAGLIKLESCYRRQLRIIWKGLQIRPKGARHE